MIENPIYCGRMTMTMLALMHCPKCDTRIVKLKLTLFLRSEGVTEVKTRGSLAAMKGEVSQTSFSPENRNNESNRREP